MPPHTADGTLTAVDPRIDLITRNLEEVLTREDLAHLLATGTPLRHYIGFEISGKIHLGGMLCMSKVKDFVDAGAHSTIFLADWHTWINDKLGGDRETIRRVAVGYFQTGLSAAFRACGGDPSQLEFVLASELYHHNDDYWATLIDVSKSTTLARMQRSITIMGRKEGESVDFAKLIYPPMQVADIFSMQINLAQAGMDQRKAHVIARDVASKMRVSPLHDATGAQVKPVTVHHPLLLGLKKPATWPPPEGSDVADYVASMKMSKSERNAAIFVHDPPDEIRAKVRKAFCPPDSVAFNPMLDWTRKLIFPRDGEFRIARTADHGGDLRFADAAELDEAFLGGALHPADLKHGVAEWLVEALEPARAAFAGPDGQRLIEELDALLAR
ncbi:MAG: tyrosine--tRNA ligase [Dehalococcoidia bacterium]|nr:tyrosine--tRNA ligase [Dehalococcoidia bacterium]